MILIKCYHKDGLFLFSIEMENNKGGYIRALFNKIINGKIKTAGDFYSIYDFHPSLEDIERGLIIFITEYLEKVWNNKDGMKQFAILYLIFYDLLSKIAEKYRGVILCVRYSTVLINLNEEDDQELFEVFTKKFRDRFISYDSRGIMNGKRVIAIDDYFEDPNDHWSEEESKDFDRSRPTYNYVNECLAELNISDRIIDIDHRELSNDIEHFIPFREYCGNCSPLDITFIFNSLHYNLEGGENYISYFRDAGADILDCYDDIIMKRYLEYRDNIHFIISRDIDYIFIRDDVNKLRELRIDLNKSFIINPFCLEFYEYDLPVKIHYHDVAIYYNATECFKYISSVYNKDLNTYSTKRMLEYAKKK
jgi:hypothetical protein